MTLVFVVAANVSAGRPLAPAQTGVAPRISFRDVFFAAAARPPHPAGDSFRSPTMPTGNPQSRGCRLASLAATAAAPSVASRLEVPSDDGHLDPIARRRSVFASHDAFVASTQARMPQGEPPTSRQDPTGPVRAASLEELFPVLVRRVAWSCDRDRAALRLELGAGELAGGTLLVQMVDGRLRVHLEVPPGVNASVWHRRICDRLADRGLPFDTVEVA